MKKFKRILALALAAMMVLSTMSVGVFAADEAHVHSEEAVVAIPCKYCGSEDTVRVGNPVAGTCTTAGYEVRKCNECEEEFIKITEPAVGHIIEETHRDEPTCTVPGTSYGSCKVCGEEEVEVAIPATGHDWEESIVRPTITEEGKIIFSCKDCDTDPIVVKVSNICKAENHVRDIVGELEATCTDEGHIAHEYCATCDAYWVDGEISAWELIVIPATDHDWQLVSTQPTCEGDVCTYACANDCGIANKVEIENPTNETHTWRETPSDDIHELLGLEDGWTILVGYTCTLENVQVYRRCEECKIVEYDAVASKGHVWALYSTVIANGGDNLCEDGGTITEWCTVCGMIEENSVEVPLTTQTTTIPAGTAHAWEVIESYGDYTTTVPACGVDGVTVSECPVCGLVQVELVELPADEVEGVVFVENEELAALEHAYTEEEVPATCSAPAYLQNVCDLCGDTVYVGLTDDPSLNPNNHTVETVISPAPTCTEDGKEFTYCTGCDALDDVLEGVFKVLPATGHVKSETYIEESATCTEGGKRIYTCTVGGCGATIEEPIEALGHVPAVDADENLIYEPLSAATCEAPGMGISYCAICLEHIGEEVEIEAQLDHAIDFDALTTENHRDATCHIPGLATGICINGCEAEVEIAIPTNDNHPAASIIDVEEVPATCTEAGTTAGKKCVLCGDITEGCTEIVPSEHAWGEVLADNLLEAYPNDAEELAALLQPRTVASCTEFARTIEQCATCGEFKLAAFEDYKSTNRTHEAAEEWTPVVNATCETEGLAHLLCSVCGVEMTDAENNVLEQVIPVLPHLIVVAGEDDPVEVDNCAGLGKDVECVGNGCAAHLMHNNVNDTILATCQHHAAKVEYCLDCAEIFDEEIIIDPELDLETLHVWSATVETVTPATCTEGGVDAIVCTTCGKVQEGTEVDTDALGHQYPVAGSDETVTEITEENEDTLVWIPVSAPSVGVAGEEKCVCKVCGNTVTREIAPSEYNLEFTYNIKHAAEDYTADGYKIVNSGLIELTIKTCAEMFDIANVSLKLDYDPAVLTFVDKGVVNSSFGSFEVWNQVNDADEENDVPATAFISMVADSFVFNGSLDSMKNITLDGEQVFIKLYFRVNDDVTANTDITFTVNAGSGITAYDSSVAGGMNDFTSEEDAATVSLGEGATAKTALLGDINGNGSVNSTDRTMIQFAIINYLYNGVYVSEADLDRDGTVGLLDYARIGLYVLGSHTYAEVIGVEQPQPKN